MNPIKQKVELSENDFWQKRLFDTIQNCHPYMLIDNKLQETQEFIINRANMAHEYYCNEKLNGVPDNEAKLNAINEVLINGLTFSPTDFLREVLSSEKGIEVNEGDIVDYYLQTMDFFVGIDNFIYDDPTKENDLKNKLLERLILS